MYEESYVLFIIGPSPPPSIEGYFLVVKFAQMQTFPELV